jgi:hypothetical protein
MKFNCPYIKCPKYFYSESGLGSHIAIFHLPISKFPEVSVYEIADKINENKI